MMHRRNTEMTVCGRLPAVMLMALLLCASCVWCQEEMTTDAGQLETADMPTTNTETAATTTETAATTIASPANTTAEPLTTIGVVVANSTSVGNETAVPTTVSTPMPTTTTAVEVPAVPAVPAVPILTFSAKISISVHVSISSFSDFEFTSRIATVIGVNARQIVILSKREQHGSSASTATTLTVVEFCIATRTRADSAQKVEAIRSKVAKNETLIEGQPAQDISVGRSDAGDVASARIRIRVRVSVRGFDDHDFAALVASSVGLTTDCVQILSKVEVDGAVTVEFRFTTNSREKSDAKCDDFIATAPKNTTLTGSYPIDSVGVAANATNNNATGTPVPAVASSSTPFVSFSAKISISVHMSISSFNDFEFTSRISAMVGMNSRQIVILSKWQQQQGGVEVTIVEFCFATRTLDEGVLKIGELRTRTAKNESAIGGHQTQIVSVERSEAGDVSSARIRIRVRVSVRGFDDHDFSALAAATVGLTTDCIEILSKTEANEAVTVEFRFTTTSRAKSDGKANDFVASAPKNATFTTAYPVEFVGVAGDAPIVPSQQLNSCGSVGASAALPAVLLLLLAYFQ